MLAGTATAMSPHVRVQTAVCLPIHQKKPPDCVVPNEPAFAFGPRCKSVGPTTSRSTGLRCTTHAAHVVQIILSTRDPSNAHPIAQCPRQLFECWGPPPLWYSATFEIHASGAWSMAPSRVARAHREYAHNELVDALNDVKFY